MPRQRQPWWKKPPGRPSLAHRLWFVAAGVAAVVIAQLVLR